MNMDCYVVRIVHDEAVRSTQERETLIGVVGNAAGTERRKFQNIDELWAILSGRSTVGKTERISGDGPTKT
jgi:hypothetical protein